MINDDELEDICDKVFSKNGHSCGSLIAKAVLELLEQRFSQFDVRRIMLDVVPGPDGEGVEVYAKSIEEVENKLTELATKLEECELGIKPKQISNFAELFQETSAQKVGNIISAFEIAVTAGKVGMPNVCPYTNPELQEAWGIGYAEGRVYAALNAD